MSILVEIVVSQPQFERFFQLGPFVIEDPETGGVTVAPFHNHVLLEYTFEEEAKTLGRAFRSLVIVVTFPFESTVAESKRFIRQ